MSCERLCCDDTLKINNRSVGLVVLMWLVFSASVGGVVTWLARAGQPAMEFLLGLHDVDTLYC